MSRLLEDLLWNLEGLVEVSLDESIGELFPVGSFKDEVLEFFLISISDGLSSLNLMFKKTILGLVNGILDHDFAGLKEVIERHSSVLLVLWLSKGLTLLNKSINDFLWWHSSIELSLLFRFLLSNNNLSEALDIFVLLKFVMSRSVSQVRKIKSILFEESI